MNDQRIQQIFLEGLIHRIDGEGFKHLRASVAALEGGRVGQEEMARRLSVTVRTYWRWEHDKSKASNLASQCIADVYGSMISDDHFYDRYRLPSDPKAEVASPEGNLEGVTDSQDSTL